jgi:hypothetical protein
VFRRFATKVSKITHLRGVLVPTACYGGGVVELGGADESRLYGREWRRKKLIPSVVVDDGPDGGADGHGGLDGIRCQ